MNCKDKKIVTIQVCLGENAKSERLGKRIGLGVERALNEFFQSKRDEGKWEDAELYFKDVTFAPNCHTCPNVGFDDAVGWYCEEQNYEYLIELYGDNYDPYDVAEKCEHKQDWWWENG